MHRTAPQFLLGAIVLVSQFSLDRLTQALESFAQGCFHVPAEIFHIDIAMLCKLEPGDKSSVLC